MTRQMSGNSTFRWSVMLPTCMTVYMLNVLLSTKTNGRFILNQALPPEEERLVSIVGLTPIDCAVECCRRPGCHSVTYMKRATYCRLYTNTSASVVTSIGVAYSERTWWTVNPCNGQCSATESCDETDGNVCISTECYNTPVVDNADTFGNMRTNGANKWYQCIEGAENIGGTSISTCGNDGLWSNVSLVCDLGGFRRDKVEHLLQMKAYIEAIYGDGKYYDMSRLQCVTVCKNETNYCQAVSYSPENRTCHLVDNIWPSIPAPGWETIHKIFPVYYAFGPNGRYTLTFEQALEYCISAGTTMASEYDLQIAYDMGFNRLDCGWVSEQIAFLPTHDTVENYWSQTGLGECRWQTTWGVFCKNPYYQSMLLNN